MEDAGSSAPDPLMFFLGRSDELHESILVLLDGTEFDPSLRGQSSFGMCSLSFEHWLSLRLLMAAKCTTSGASLVRLQFEALVRAMWLLWAASDLAVDKLSARLTPESEQAAKNLPSVSKMIEDIGKRVGSGAPAVAHQMLVHFQEVQRHALNSFVHGGIHPLRRHSEGFPLQLVLQIVQTSNALATMAGMTLALLSGDERVTLAMSRIQPEFRDCLPELQR